ncbi:PFK4 [Symbiodinium pilosum]|uniref:PFK4 protein n=1 Tax=Symbiodinium pilosum TaxID=2952 RepID=A0A812W3I9_SYMPI|nr:PFK4 [Symbiodinium pilosum]
MAGKADLVQQIKNMQRADPNFRQTWWDFCEAQLGGVRDPNRHDESILGTFLEQYNSGAIAPSPYRAEEEWWNKGKGKGGMKGAMSYNMMPPPSAWGMTGGGGGVAGLPDFVKTGQRASYHWKNAWTIYCALYGAGKNDPAKHDEIFNKGFIDYVGELAANGLSSIASSQGINLDEITAQTNGKGRAPLSTEPAPKRFRFEEADTAKLELVEKVKNLQRSNPQAKEAWWAYCDGQCGGMRDPMRHDAPSLQTFLTSQGTF